MDTIYLDKYSKLLAYNKWYMNTIDLHLAVQNYQNGKEDLPYLYHAIIGDIICPYQTLASFYTPVGLTRRFWMTLESGGQYLTYNRITDGIVWKYPEVGGIIRTEYKEITDKYGNITYAPQFVKDRIVNVRIEQVTDLIVRENDILDVRGLSIGTLVDGFPVR